MVSPLTRARGAGRQHLASGDGICAAIDGNVLDDGPGDDVGAGAAFARLDRTAGEYTDSAGFDPRPSASPAGAGCRDLPLVRPRRLAVPPTAPAKRAATCRC